jgi:hypothetical protein
MTGDESWIFWLNSHTAQWLSESNLRSKKSRLTIRAKKSIICLSFSLREFLAVSLLGDGDTFNFDFMINVVFPEIRTKIAEQCSQKDFKNLILHMDNVPYHNSRQSTAEIEKLELS